MCLEHSCNPPEDLLIVPRTPQLNNHPRVFSRQRPVGVVLDFAKVTPQLFESQLVSVLPAIHPREASLQKLTVTKARSLGRDSL